MTSRHPPTIQRPEFWEELDQFRLCKNPTLRWILHGFDENFGDKVHELKTTWNQKIRAHFRDVLSLSTKNAPIQIRWKLDQEGSFVDLVEREYPDLDFEELLALRRFVSETHHVRQYFRHTHVEAALTNTREYAEHKLRKYNLGEIIETLFIKYRKERGEPFGTYFGKDHSIEIYLIPNIVFSMLIEEDFLDMTIGTLAHEIAHGFHHVGADKDGHTWETFWNAEKALTEGLAEFYTSEFARSIESAKPEVLRAFEKTQPHLPDIYRSYKKWDEGHDLEVIYQTFIEARRNDVRTVDDFKSGLSETAGRLSGH